MRRHAISAMSAAAALGLAWAAPAQASCAQTTPEQQRQNADVIFDGIALEGPNAAGVQRFRVSRYLKGTGPGEVGVVTGVVKWPDGRVQTSSVSVEAEAGQPWRIYGTKAGDGRLDTNQCAGSRILSSLAGAPPLSTASKSSRTGLVLGTSLVAFALLGGALALRRRASRSG